MTKKIVMRINGLGAKEALEMWKEKEHKEYNHLLTAETDFHKSIKLTVE